MPRGAPLSPSGRPVQACRLLLTYTQNEAARFEGAIAMNRKVVSTALAAVSLAFVMAACEQKGPVEQTAEEVDEAVDTIKRGGDESTANKVDDAVDEAREAATDK